MVIKRTEKQVKGVRKFTRETDMSWVAPSGANQVEVAGLISENSVAILILIYADALMNVSE